MNELLEAEVNDVHASIGIRLAEPKRLLLLYSLAALGPAAEQRTIEERLNHPPGFEVVATWREWAAG